MNDFALFYRAMYRIRCFEEQVLAGFSQGLFAGTTHTCLGQEANAVGVISALNTHADIVVSNHRSHGHFLAYGGDMRALFAELMGKPSGVCEGWSGSQHLHWRNFYANGIQGGMLPSAVGMALAEKRLGRSSVTVVFLGDGTLGEGVVYESFNLAALWHAPLLFVLEDNRIAQTTSTDLNLAGSMAARFSAFGIAVQELDSVDVLEIYRTSKQLIEKTRVECEPNALILHGYRLGPHSKGDDTRGQAELTHINEEHDGVKLLASRLGVEERYVIETEVNEEVRAAFEQARSN